jgi:protease IV
MDSEQYGNQMSPAQPPQKKRNGWQIVWGIFTAMSVFANIALFFAVIILATFFAIGQKDSYTENVLREGPRMTKIGVVNLEGVIGSEKSREVCRQLEMATKDNSIKALILRVNSPGGTVSGSDQIYNEIRKYRQNTNKPVVAFMSGMAASGGYYASVACDEIIAEPTTITGSIGVIMDYFVLQNLLEEKLGVQPVIIKSGLKKDWPSLFQAPTDEQRQYIQDKLIKPTFQRFKEIVAEGRKDKLTPEDVNRLADGSIYGAQEALDEKLIDQIGYLDDAIKLACKMAGIQKAQVIEFRKPFSLSGFLSSESESKIKLNRAVLHELTMPEIMYLCSGY